MLTEVFNNILINRCKKISWELKYSTKVLRKDCNQHYEQKMWTKDVNKSCESNCLTRIENKSFLIKFANKSSVEYVIEIVKRLEHNICCTQNCRTKVMNKNLK